MMSKPFFSVIVPAHNAADRIRKGLNSIKRQTFTDYELIIICDDCQDDTAKIALGYADCVRVVDLHSCGKSRNAGLDEARGQWILFMDDDDWWMHDHVLADLDKRLGSEDVLRFGFVWKGEGYKKPGPWIAVWNKCWRRSFIGATRFSSVKWWSDVDFNRLMMDKNPRIVDWDEPLYYYNFMREGSISWQNIHGT